MSEPRVAAVVWLPLSRAALCLSCDQETVFDVQDQECPTCGSEHWQLLQTWLGSTKDTTVK